MRPRWHRSRLTATTVLVAALPCLVVLLSVIVWVVGVSRSGFWADDFLNVTTYNNTLGNLSNDRINTGKYIGNFFWALGTEAFGTSSVIPFLILNMLVFAGGLLLWLWAGTRGKWRVREAWWIGGLFIATAAWLPTALWSSNIVHSGGFLALGAGLCAHERCMQSSNLRRTVMWSLASGVAWTLAVVSDLLYIGLMVIALYCALDQVVRMRYFGVGRERAVLAVAGWGLLLPVVYFVTVAYPATTASSAYATTGLRFVRQNLSYYRAGLAPTSSLTAIYVLVLAVSLAGGLVALRRRDGFPLAVLGAAGATAVPALVQGQQRAIHYLAMPLLLSFSAAAAAVRPVLLGTGRRSSQARGVLIATAALAIWLVFSQGADVRSYFVESPYGRSLAAFRSQVASLTPSGATICARLSVSPPDRALFVAEMSGQNGFLVPPISAARVDLVADGQTCPPGVASGHIIVSRDARGEFVAVAG